MSDETRKFYRQVFHWEILSAGEPLPEDVTIYDVNDALLEGICSGKKISVSTHEISRKKAVALLAENFCSPEMFRLDDEGNDLPPKKEE